MPVTSTLTKVIAEGNDVATEFSFSPIVIFEASDLEVIHVDAEGVETTLSLGTGASNYSVAAATTFPGTGSITYPADEVTPLPTGESLVIKRVLPLTQSVNLKNQGGYFPNTVEEMIDRLAMIDQQLQEQIDRSVKVPVGSTVAIDELVAALLAAESVATAAKEDAEAALAEIETIAGSILRVSGANIRPGADATTQNLTTTGSVAMDTAIEQTKTPDGHKYFLGTDLTFTVADSGLDTLTATAHDTITGDGPLFVSSSTTLPAGLATATPYWVIRIDDNTIKLASSYANAIAGTAVDITDAGTGTHTLLRASRLVVPNGITKVRVGAGLYLTDFATDGDFAARIAKNGSGATLIPGLPNVSLRGTEIFGDDAVNLASGPIPVSAGDYFELSVNISDDTSVTIQAEGTYLWIEAIS